MLSEKFISAPVHEKLEQLKMAIANKENREILPVENVQFFEAFLNYCTDRLRLTIPLLIQEAELNSLSAEIESGTSQISTYIGNKNIGHLNNAVNNFNSALNRIRNFPFPSSKDDFNFSNQVASFQNAVETAYNTLNTYAQNIHQKLIDTEKELGTKETKIQELSQKLAEKETEIQTVLTRYNSEFDTLKTTANTALEADRKKITEEIEADRKLFTGMVADDRKLFKEAFDTQISNSAKLSSELTGKINTKLEEAKKIVNIIGNVGVTGNYQNIANQNKQSANFFRWVALIFMIIMSGLLIWSIIDLSITEFNIYKSLVRILAAAVLTYPAIYASRESTRHRNLETKNRNLELELASIGPFIEILPEPKKQEIKHELVKKYFGNHNLEIPGKKEEEEDVSINALEKILKAILPFIKK